MDLLGLLTINKGHNFHMHRVGFVGKTTVVGRLASHKAAPCQIRIVHDLQESREAAKQMAYSGHALRQLHLLEFIDRCFVLGTQQCA